MIQDRMPFGKHKGRPIGELPLDYVVWLRENAELREPLKTQIELVYRRLTAPTRDPAYVDLNGLRRKFAAKYHPDRPNGSRVAMAAINDVFDCLHEKAIGANTSKAERDGFSFHRMRVVTRRRLIELCKEAVR